MNRREDIQHRKNFLTTLLAGRDIATKYPDWWHEYYDQPDYVGKMIWVGDFAAKTERMSDEQECADWQSSAAATAYRAASLMHTALLDGAYYIGAAPWQVVALQNRAAEYYKEARERLLTLLDNSSS